MVLKNCDAWLAAGYFGWESALPVGNGSAPGQTGVKDSVWKALDAKVENEA